ncbi:sigma-70 family RNA polymerase sigma factor [Ruania alkalisoli]|uniref:Sigma-70 family RNA polymerase sigma factor n=1 Tax=Ruania alkalisoli TaxID=2779775 RepID=A0A7M1STR8_9MICO|nr:sigma-70 family RNA polymerase sigma factor [Ruania alkalisoli]QOR70915.1 sigma-70 family RNA polymerase sigma factor [Ruania alkalisoli]
MPDPADADLVRRARNGEKVAFEEIVRRHGPAMYRFGLRMLRDEHAVRDCVQEAFASAWEALDQFRGDAAVKTWLFSILANKVRRYLRSQGRTVPAEIDETAIRSPAQHEPERRAIAGTMMAALEEALDELPLAQRACWILYEVEGLSYRRIAQIQGMSVDAVRGAIYRARQGLERRLEAWR